MAFAFISEDEATVIGSQSVGAQTGSSYYLLASLSADGYEAVPTPRSCLPIHGCTHATPIVVRNVLLLP